jgi:hypothetical protein
MLVMVEFLGGHLEITCPGVADKKLNMLSIDTLRTKNFVAEFIGLQKFVYFTM